MARLAALALVALRSPAATAAGTSPMQPPGATAWPSDLAWSGGKT